MRQNPLAVGVVADDLTGALDTAAPFAANGLETWLTLRIGTVGHLDPGTQVLALTTESRHLSAEQAAERVHAATRALVSLRPDMVFKKIDSMLRGNGPAEIVAAMISTGRRHAIVAPAVPSQNRTMRNGTIYIDGLELAATNRAREDGKAPMSAHLPDLLQKLGTLQIHIVPIGQSLTLAAVAGLHAYVADAETQLDLDMLAQFVIGRSPEVLSVGASGFARALARVLAQSRPGPMPQLGAGTLLFVIGSRRGTSAAQIEALRAAGADEIAVPVGPELDLEDFPARLTPTAAPSILLVRPESFTTKGVAANEIAKRLGRVAATIVRRLRPAGLVMSGGDTAAACLESLEADSLHVLGELHDGIAFGTVFLGAGAMPFFTKSGSFGSRDTWIRLVARLQAG